MGYYTRYSLEVRDSTPDFLNAVDEHGNAEELISEKIGYDPFDQECKWYDHEDDMLDVSKKFPEVLFVLEGEGEESGDQWIKYFRNGKSQHCKAIITFPAFDEGQMI